MNEQPPKSRGILFQGDLAIAILNGRKNQTRRLIPDESRYHHWNHAQPMHPDFSEDFPGAVADSWLMQYERGPIRSALFQPLSCKYGIPGDELFVKETFQMIENDSDGSDLIYRADYRGESLERINRRVKWKPALFMGRATSRMTLAITFIRIERLQDIDEEDSCGEGCHSDFVGPDAINFEDEFLIPRLYARDEFAVLWDSFNAAPKPCEGMFRWSRDHRKAKIVTHYVSYPWEDETEIREHKGLPWFVFGNPWVHVIDFKKTETVADVL